MTIYTCTNCAKVFNKKSHYEEHLKLKNECEKMKEINIKLNDNDNNDNIEYTMEDYAKKSREELIAICKEKKIKGYSGKKRDEIIQLLDTSIKNDLIINNTNTHDTNESLLNNILEKYSLKETANLLNLAIGTIQRWIELKNIPSHYKFDLLRILSKDINPQDYKSSEKDQFFTPEHITERCWSVFKDKVDIDIDDYIFIEPSAGDGAFLKILPKNTIALDIEPRNKLVKKQDYLLWKPTDMTKKYIVFGNPPFGLRGHVALNFIRHSLEFADYVCFILPQLFESDGKGSPRKRVKGYNLIHSEKISALFYTPENTNIGVNGVFQIWSKFTTNKNYIISKPNQDNIKVYSLSDGGTVSSTRNKKMLYKCDIYLPSTCFGKENMKIYNTFDELPGRKGYGIVFLKNKEIMKKKSKTIDWSNVSFLSTNSAYNLRTSIMLDTLNKISG
jgi:hypothetical protein